MTPPTARSTEQRARRSTRRKAATGGQVIVVPLDGSPLAEAALPYARLLARASGARLLLVTVWDESQLDVVSGLPDVVREIGEQASQRYQAYLDGLARNLRRTTEVETALLVGRPQEEILRLLQEREAQMLVLATHGRSGLSRWFYGSVASRLVREAPVPTVVIGPRALPRAAPRRAIRRILVPLDGSGLAETALLPAVDLAGRLGARLVLAQVLSWASQAYLYGVANADVARIDQDLTRAAQAYLERVRARFNAAVPVATRVLHGLPADALIGLAEREKIDLVVMASHTRSGLARAVLGSVADRMLQGSAPVLLIRPEAPRRIAHRRARASRSRYCHNCGRAVPYTQVKRDERCLRCGQLLHVCANCVYFDGITCLMKRPEVHDVYPGRTCPAFQFRESAPPRRALRPRRQETARR